MKSVIHVRIFNKLLNINLRKTHPIIPVTKINHVHLCVLFYVSFGYAECPRIADSPFGFEQFSCVLSSVYFSVIPRSC